MKIGKWRSITCSLLLSYHQFSPIRGLSSGDRGPRSQDNMLTEGPGSTGKKRPLSWILSFISIHDTDGCTIMSILDSTSVLRSKTLELHVHLLIWMKFNDFVHVHKVNAQAAETSREMAFDT
jgi:hypothetical protein